MQPYLYPYIGYFQLISAADKFVIADNYQYTKQTWINRNRLILNNRVRYLSIPVSKHTQNTLISEIRISEQYSPTKEFDKIKNSYGKSKGWNDFSASLHKVLHSPTTNLLHLVENSILSLTSALRIDTDICKLSELGIPGKLAGEERVIAICKALGANQYINPPGGIDLYSKQNFSRNGIDLLFLEPILKEYRQKLMVFESHLSILDIGLSVGKEELINSHLPGYRV
jgi:hypothetical protein